MSTSEHTVLYKCNCFQLIYYLNDCQKCVNQTGPLSFPFLMNSTVLSPLSAPHAFYL